jgi:signal transduction histidine kinase
MENAHFIDIIPLISAIFVFFLGLFVFLKNRHSRINFTFFLHSLAITAWLFCTFMMFINRDNREMAIFWDRFVYAGVVFIPVFMYHFGLAFTSRKRNFLLYFAYFLSFSFLFLVPTEYFVNDVFEYKWGIHTKAQLFHHIFLIYFVGYTMIWFVEMYRYYKGLRLSIQKQQTKYVFFAFLVLFTIGPLAYLPAYGMGIYPFAYVSGLIFTIILAYAIVRHRLLDIKLVMRKSSVFLASIITIIILAVFANYVLVNLIPNSVDWLIYLSILVLSLLFFPSIRKFYYRLANKYFFSSLYDSQEVIANMSEKLRSTLEVQEIYNFVYNSLTSAFHSKSFGILSYDQKSNNYLIRYNQGFKLGEKRKFPGNETLHKMFIQKNEPIITEEIKSEHYNAKTKSTIDLLTSLKVEILAPLNVKDKTVGLIVLGPKESGDMYNEEDLQVLKTIGAFTAISIDHALQYKKTLSFNIRLKQEVEKATEELRKANRELKKLDAAKSEFISIASHQLRTPLTVIKGYVSMLLEESFGQITLEERTSLTKIYESNERLIQLVENLLNISRIESGRLQFDFQSMQLEKLTDSVVEELSDSAKNKGLKLSYKKPSEPLPKTKIDEEKLRQVVMNLIDNAIKYTKKGSVTVTLRKVGERIQFCVSDSGMGISKEDLTHLFKKFSRGEGTSVVHTEGTGLGLYVAKEMIRSHKGKIWAESDGEGKGSRFYFEIPIG